MPALAAVVSCKTAWAATAQLIKKKITGRKIFMLFPFGKTSYKNGQNKQ